MPLSSPRPGIGALVTLVGRVRDGASQGIPKASNSLQLSSKDRASIFVVLRGVYIHI